MGNLCIISDDCFGWGVYNTLKLQYNTPFISTLIHTPDYIKLLYNLDYYLNCELTKIDTEESNYHKLYGCKPHVTTIVGKLKDIEIVFCHYDRDAQTTFDTWYRRRDRMYKEKNRLLIKMGSIEKHQDHNKQLCHYDNFNELIKQFYKLPYGKKLTFTKDKLQYPNNFKMLPHHLYRRDLLGMEFKRYIDILKFAK